MMKDLENSSFEEALAGLEESVGRLRSSEVTLEESMKGFEEGMACYNRCVSLLEEARGKIRIYAKESNALEDFQV